MRRRWTLKQQRRINSEAHKTEGPALASLAWARISLSEVVATVCRLSQSACSSLDPSRHRFGGLRSCCETLINFRTPINRPGRREIIRYLTAGQPESFSHVVLAPHDSILDLANPGPY
jgi:hypothetical protein